ncbi:hypothetical protein F0562_026289 [Nyssa sinensis]|uniref:Protein kinase domain-containing protein n=1 Tax=Nyssa sinensis TaxID=561372 RepID=A0A5J5BCZ5_9ASTE|nr:hypothetical protein F0562_026289 [Nyssa sinensis]
MGIQLQSIGLGNEVSAKGDIYSYGILLLEMMTRKKPTDPMFEDDLDHQSFAGVALPGIILLEVLTGKRPILDDDFNLHSFAREAFPDRVMEIVDPILLKDIEEESTKECLISMVRIGVACSIKSPQDRMEIKEVIRELNLIRDILQGTRKRPIRKRPMLNLRMTWLPGFEKSHSQEDPKSDSHEKPWFPNLEIFYCRKYFPSPFIEIERPSSQAGRQAHVNHFPCREEQNRIFSFTIKRNRATKRTLQLQAQEGFARRVMEIVDPLLLKDLENDLVAECLISMVRIGVACSMKSPQDRMDIKKVIDELNLVRDILQGTRKRPTRRRPTLDLRMSWLVSLEKSNRQEESSLPNFEKSYCQEESESYSQGEPCLPIFENSYSQEESESCSQEESESYSQGEPCPPNFENSYCQEESESYSQGEPCLPIFENSFNQEESWLLNFENSFSQEESWLPNFEKSYIYSGLQETSFPTQKMFSNFVPLLPKPAPLLPWEGPSWISFEESYRREEPKSDIHGKPWIPKFEKSLSEKES